MTAQELHISIDILLQKVSSNWNKNFLPQEVDFFINREILKFIKRKLNPRSDAKQLTVFDTIKRTQDLDSLLRTVTLPVVDYNQKEAIYRLPFDFLYYVSSEVEVTPKCDTITIPYIPFSYYYKSIAQLRDVSAISSVILSVTINTITTLLFDYSLLPSQFIPQDGVADYRKRFIYNNAMLVEITKNLPDGLEIEVNNVTKDFTFRSSNDFTLTFNINGNNQQVTPTVINQVQASVNKSLTAEVRIVDEEFKTPIKRSYLSGSKDESLVGYLREGFVVLPLLPNVVASSARLTYIKKPDRVDVLLDSNSDLPNPVLEEIASNVTEAVKAVIASDTLDKFKQENFLIE